MTVLVPLYCRDVILFHHEGGVDIGDVESKAARSARYSEYIYEITLVHSRFPVIKKSLSCGEKNEGKGL